LRKPSPRSWLLRRHSVPRDVEYRTCSVPTKADAKAVAAQLRGQIQSYWRQVSPA
jgi:hypothetical protein